MFCYFYISDCPGVDLHIKYQLTAVVWRCSVIAVGDRYMTVTQLATKRNRRVVLAIVRHFELLVKHISMLHWSPCNIIHSVVSHVE